MDPVQDADLMWIAEKGIGAPAPPPWIQCATASGEIYYFNQETNQAVWDHPLDEEFKKLYQEEKRKKLAGSGIPQSSSPKPEKRISDPIKVEEEVVEEFSLKDLESAEKPIEEHTKNEKIVEDNTFTLREEKKENKEKVNENEKKSLDKVQNLEDIEIVEDIEIKKEPEPEKEEEENIKKAEEEELKQKQLAEEKMRKYKEELENNYQSEIQVIFSFV